MLDNAGDTVLTAGIDAGVDTTDEGADDIGRLFATDAGVEVTRTTAPDELGSNDATTAVPETVKTFEAEVAISRANTTMRISFLLAKNLALVLHQRC